MEMQFDKKPTAQRNGFVSPNERSTKRHESALTLFRAISCKFVDGSYLPKRTVLNLGYYPARGMLDRGSFIGGKCGHSTGSGKSPGLNHLAVLG